MILQIDGRNAKRANRRGRQVDHQDTQLIELAAVFGMHVSAGGIKRDLNIVFFHVRQQAIHAFGGDFHAHVSRALQAIRRRVDADHPYRL